MKINNLSLYTLLLTAVLAASEKEECDKTKCSGPLAYYKALGCTPIYENSGDCCARRYNCDQVTSRSKNKCYVNGKSYEIGESLKEEDANPCDIGCKCSEKLGVASFNCAVVDCFFGNVTPGCYRKGSPLSCCPENEICPENPEDRLTCEVEGKIYKDGEYFFDPADPEKNCVCQEGFKGELIEPFCAIPKHPYCSPTFRHANDVFNNCAPVYYSSQPPQTSCSVFSRCQNVNDTVINNNSSESKSTDSNGDNSEEMMCQFGQLKMNLGDELNQATDYNSVCVKCVCEVPPIPTCQRLPEECDVTKHPPFHQM